eukprot:TRINITY_DN15911_c0_g1_i1.p1 TRINITY_DN15911_c0_g1~~TRINITY_DN15911_c0_g1_i1.p1  ORF type:complete len:352 (-),score=39.79 TRINITY_DN15911_c0_g1_i1:334-1389(-)
MRACLGRFFLLIASIGYVRNVRHNDKSSLNLSVVSSDRDAVARRSRHSGSIHGSSTVKQSFMTAGDKQATINLIRDIFGVIGTLMAIVMYSSSFPVLRKIYQRGETGEYSFTPYLTMFLNASAWVNYCPHFGLSDMISNFVANFLGAWLAMVSLAMFGYFAQGEVKQSFVKIVGSVLLVHFVAIAATWFTNMDCSARPPVMSSCWWSPVTIFLNCIMYVGPCSILKRVWDTKSVEFMPLSISVGSFLCSLPWMIVGFCNRDPAGWFPSVLGIILSTVQLFLYTYVKVVHGNKPVSEEAPLGAFLDADVDVDPLPQRMYSFGGVPSLTRTSFRTLGSSSEPLASLAKPKVES